MGTWQYRNFQMRSNHLTEVPNHIPTTSIIQSENNTKKQYKLDSFVAPVNDKWIESVDQYAKEFFGHTPRIVQLLLDSKRTVQSLVCFLVVCTMITKPNLFSGEERTS